MMRGTFANTRLRNRLVPEKEGGFTKHIPSGALMSIFDASEEYRAAGVPTIILAGKEYGSGSSRDWAAKGPRLLGVRAVIAQSFERIHRSNLVGMGVLPLQFLPDEEPESQGLTGEESYEITGLREIVEQFKPGCHVTVKATAPDGAVTKFEASVRIDTPQEALYFQHGGILHYVIRQLLQS
jgi:aconitate hydratase